MIFLTKKQSDCLKTVIKLFKEKQKIITIGGFAGTGKSTVINTLVNELNLQNNVAYATFTGKASLVLRNKGLPATTIHKLIYDCFIDDFGVIHTCLKEKLDSYIKLIVIDEISMVSKKILNDLLSFNIPIITLGDPGQLEPIGEDNGLLKHPDFVLTEIIRQAADNPIIYLSMLAREGKFDRMNNDKVKVLKRNELSLSMIDWAEQCLCGFNKTRQFINQNMRKYYFDTDELLPIVGDKIISLRNCWKTFDSQNNPLINGTIGYVDKINCKYRNRFKISFKDLDNNSYYNNIDIQTATFLNNEPSPTSKKPIFDYGYAITVHKSQGSEYNKVILIDECLNKNNYNKWLYTGITRAKDKLIIIKD